MSTLLGRVCAASALNGELVILRDDEGGETIILVRCDVLEEGKGSSTRRHSVLTQAEQHAVCNLY